MKKIIIVMALLAIIGCAPKYTIPDEPKFIDMKAYLVDGGLCFDHDNAAVLQANIKMLDQYAKQLREILEKMKDEK